MLAALVQFAKSPWDFWAANSLLLYGANIASFVGALHWGPLLGPQSNTATNNFWRDKGAWIWGVVPSLFAWIALHVALSTGYFIIAATLLMALLVDRQQFCHLISDEAYLKDFLKMRAALTLVATASLVWVGFAIR